ncbi:hypothetical protein [Mycoplasmopsis arginini]|nr:hypothetical protein [Mycoplasmopsis arginini]
MKIKIYNLKTLKLLQSCFLAYNFLYKNSWLIIEIYIFTKTGITGTPMF